MHPILITIPPIPLLRLIPFFNHPLPIHTFGVLMGSGFLAGILYAMWRDSTAYTRSALTPRPERTAA